MCSGYWRAAGFENQLKNSWELNSGFSNESLNFVNFVNFVFFCAVVKIRASIQAAIFKCVTRKIAPRG
jgi:hypothetical protein